MTKRDQAELTRRIQRDIFEDRATIEGPMFQDDNTRLAVAIFGEKALAPNFCSACEEKRPHSLTECGRRIGTNA